MKRPYFILIPSLMMVLSLVSCEPPQIDIVTDYCEDLSPRRPGGYAVEIRGIPEIDQLDISRTVETFSRKITEELRPYDKDSIGYPRDYSYVAIFYDSAESEWFTAARYLSPNAEPGELSQKRGFWDTKVKRIQYNSQIIKDGSLRFWISALGDSCMPDRDGGSIPTDKTRTDFLSFGLYYNGKFYDGSDLIHYQEDKEGDRMVIPSPAKVRIIEEPATPEMKAGFYPPFFVKYPEFIFSRGLHVIQFSALKPVKPDPAAPGKKNTGKEEMSGALLS